MHFQEWKKAYPYWYEHLSPPPSSIPCLYTHIHT